MIPQCKKDRIIVSATEPTTNEKVWIQKGKNLFNVNQLNVLEVGNASYSVQNDQINITSQAQFSSIDLLVKVIPNKQHYISMDVINSVAGRVNVSIYSKDYSTHYIQQWILDSTSGKIGLTFTPNAEEIVFRLYSNAGGEVTNNTATFSNIQLEQGSTPTEYEPYVEKKIWCKNDNGVYEEFINVEKVNNLTEDIKIYDITVAPSTTCQVAQSVAKDGYEALGIIMCDMSSNHVLLAKYAVWGEMVYLNLANYSGSSQTTSITIRVLYKKL